MEDYKLTVISYEKAIELFNEGCEVFIIYDDGSESLIEALGDFLNDSISYGIEKQENKK